MKFLQHPSLHMILLLILASCGGERVDPDKPNPFQGDYLLAYALGGGDMLIPLFYSENNIVKIDRVNTPDPYTADYDYTYLMQVIQLKPQ